jgi:hypothetical protein
MDEQEARGPLMLSLLGYRRCALLLFAAMWVGIGVGIILDPDNALSRQPLLLELLPTWLRVALWWTAAVLAAIGSFWPERDKWAWVALSVPASLRAISYAIGSLAGWINVNFAISWIVILCILGVLSAWPEPPRAHKERGQQ